MERKQYKNIFLPAIAAVLATVLCLGSCGQSDPKDDGNGEKPKAAPPTSIKLTSTSFEAGKPLPKKCTGQGEDISPQLAWTLLPEGTKELAIICDDPDAPTTEPWVHWVLAKIPADAGKLDEGASSAKAKKHPAGMTDGKNDFKTIGYQGPMPPPGKEHRYFFRIYALDAAITVPAEPTKADVLKAMEGHILATGELMGTYKR